MIIQKWLFIEKQANIKNKNKEVYKPKTIKQLAREKIKINDKNYL